MTMGSGTFGGDPFILTDTAGYLPMSAPISTPYVIVGPGGITAVVNDPSDARWVGDLSDITGLDSTDVRENGEARTRQDGGVHGPFYRDRRAITMTGYLNGHSTLAGREILQDRLERATDAFLEDGLLQWETASGAPVQIAFRRQQPIRFTGAWYKDFQVGLVSESAVIEGQGLKTESTTAGDALVQTLSVENQGSYRTPGALPELVKIWGPITSAELFNTTTDKTMVKIDGTIASGEFYAINFKDKTAVTHTGANVYDAIDFLATTWSGIVTGVNDLELRGSGGGGLTQIQVDYRNTWN